MESRRIEIVEMEVEELIEKLNRALADEWLATYQYWLGARVLVGPMRGAAAGELAEHADDELRHAGLLAERIIQLGGTPLLSPEEWYKATNCGYEAPADPTVVPVLEQNIKGEQCAIDFYNGLLKELDGKDPVTYRMILEILEDEVEHEADLQSLLEDIGVMKRKVGKEE